jgi:L-asparaginase
MAIRVFITGGTFDKTYDEISGRLLFKDTHIQEMLQLGRCRLDVAVRTLMMVDSLEMTDADRQVVLQNCRSAAEERVVITHGTDTMTDTARVLGETSLPKTIVLTGAMVPYAFGSSDGVQALPHGVYVAMNGRCFPWDDVVKNRALGVFEPRG